MLIAWSNSSWACASSSVAMLWYCARSIFWL